MNRTVAVLTLTPEAARELIRDAVREALAAERHQPLADAERLSLSAAARMAHTRPAKVLEALRRGTLKGTKTGRDWSITAAHVRAWTESGRPS